MGKSQRDKGARVERKILATFKDQGLLPALGIPTVGDLEIEGKSYEVKARKNGAGFSTIKKWLGENYGLILVEDRANPLIVLRLDDFILDLKNQKN